MRKKKRKRKRKREAKNKAKTIAGMMIMAARRCSKPDLVGIVRLLLVAGPVSLLLLASSSSPSFVFSKRGRWCAWRGLEAGCRPQAPPVSGVPRTPLYTYFFL